MEELDVFTLRKADASGHVASFFQALTITRVADRNSRLLIVEFARDRLDLGTGAVIADHHFESRIGLVKNALQRRGKVAVLVGGNDDADERWQIHGQRTLGASEPRVVAWP